MCKKRKDTRVSDPKSRPSSLHPNPSLTSTPTTSSSFSLTISGSFPTADQTTSNSFSSSFPLLRDSLREGPTLFPFSELSAATHHFLSSPLSPSSWRCSLRSTDSVVVRRPLSSPSAAASLPSSLSSLSRCHHRSLARLLGASLAADHLYLVYKYIPGATLKNSLRNPRNPSFTPISTWTSRIQIAADLAQGLEYIHHQSGTVHNRIKSSAVVITDPDLRAKICHFGAAELAGEFENERRLGGSRSMKIEGTRGYLAPEVLAGGRISMKSDVFAFGVVLLEILSGEEPVKYRTDEETRDCIVVSLIETAREAIGTAASQEEEEEERKGRVRRWVDLRLRDSFPVEVAEKLMRVALRCVDSEAAMRPDMVWVAGKVSRLFLESRAWGESLSPPTDISVSFAPR